MNGDDDDYGLKVKRRGGELRDEFFVVCLRGSCAVVICGMVMETERGEWSEGEVINCW